MLEISEKNMDDIKFSFEKLDVYQKSLDLTGKIFDIFEELPYRVQKSIGDNLIRAAMSIANNIAEGSGRRGIREKRYFFEISQGSIFECIPMLTILCRKEALKESRFKELYNECYVISKMVGGLVKRFS